MARHRLVSVLFLIVAACGGSGGGAGAAGTTSGQQSALGAGTAGQPGAPAAGTTGAAAGGTGTAILTIAGAPATPAPAAAGSTAPPAGASGSNRFQIGAAQGLYVVDAVPGESVVQGLLVVTSGPINSGNFIPPADTTVTLNGVPMLRDPNLNGAYWRVDPSAPPPVVGSGGSLVLVASATVSGAPVERTLVLPCPADVSVTVTNTGSALHLSSAANLTVNAGVPSMAGAGPTATLLGYDPGTRAISPSGASTFIAAGALELDVPITATTAPAYLLDLRWPGQWVVDGESGAFCGLAKRWAFLK